MKIKILKYIWVENRDFQHMGRRIIDQEVMAINLPIGAKITPQKQHDGDIILQTLIETIK
jgi:hypothetical protein